MEKITFYSKEDWEKFRKELQKQYPENRSLDWQVGKPANYPVVLAYEVWENSTYAGISGIYVSNGDLKTEPKFKEGDWIARNTGHQVYRVHELICNKQHYNLYDPSDGHYYHSPVHLIDPEFHRWSIEDARPGDVLFSGIRCTFLFKKVDTDRKYSESGDAIIYYACWNGVFTPQEGVGVGTVRDVKAGHMVPATFDQIQTLSKGMKEAGFMWDSKNMGVQPLGPETVDSYETACRVLGERNLSKTLSDLGLTRPQVAYIQLSTIARALRKNYPGEFNIFAHDLLENRIFHGPQHNDVKPSWNHGDVGLGYDLGGLSKEAIIYFKLHFKELWEAFLGYKFNLG